MPRSKPKSWPKKLFELPAISVIAWPLIITRKQGIVISRHGEAPHARRLCDVVDGYGESPGRGKYVTERAVTVLAYICLRDHRNACRRFRQRLRMQRGPTT